jgi:hypothetical protein
MEGMDLNRWWGALAAVACGAGFRHMDAIVTTAGTAGVAVVVGACFIAFMDAASGG